ncbi:zinc finger protein 83-like [Rhopalosiphum padi]|uniref:zinc finger protein 83-like n=1 Tax=Rhopalosiphum padi TaxID=40932 RepID=UPI00298DE436|nr:zinc finger protein 83-like [Rhopalosiphum padi]XP_060834626.1 zinc finger protein 83-like [Rhopalosiphum padi]XP_060834627.1 zinc finger protein 83-like [Rhopalosiphum padi]
MLNPTNNNVDSEKWKEIVSDEIQSDIENYSDNELPLSSIVTTNNINTEKWQDIILDNIQSNMKNESENELSLSSISTFNDNHRIPKHQEINLDDTQSDNENCLDNELPLSSIANVLLPSDSCKFEKSESIDYRSKLNVNHNTSVFHQISTKDQSKIDTPMRRYGCDICGKIFLRRIAIIEHFRTSLCFPDSPFDFELNSPNYYLCNNSEDSMSFVNNINNLETNNMKTMTYKCRVCQNVIRNNSLIKRQQILHTKENNLLCNICSVLNSIACGNNQHLKEKYTWKCKSCGQTFTKLSVLKAHRCIFPKNKLFNCYKCHKSYKNLNALEKHKIVHKLNCNICHKQFFKQSTLTDHKRIHCLKSINQPNIHLKYMNSSVLNTKKTFNTSKNYECSRCSELFHKRSEIISHIFENHQEDYSKYSCDECTNFSDSSRDYILCLAKNHCKCDVCPQSFTTSHRLQQHYRWHLGINNFICQFCPKTFSKCFLYLSHERTHTGEKPFRCNFCGKWFPETSNLNIHLKPYKLFACNICQKSYTQMSSLLFHKRIHAKEKRQIKSCNQLSTLEVRTRRQYTRRKHFNCKLCAKSFFHSWSLSAHLKTHQNSKNVKKSSLNKHKRPQDAICIKCNLCQESFSDQNILITHRCKSSTCKYCLKVFNNISSLNRHYRYMHQKNNELFDCDICKISFMCSTSLNEHLKKHTLCDKNMPLTFNVTNEINTAKEEMYLDEEYKCDICMKSFFSQTQILAHILETHL